MRILLICVLYFVFKNPSFTQIYIEVNNGVQKSFVRNINEQYKYQIDIANNNFSYIGGLGIGYSFSNAYHQEFRFNSYSSNYIQIRRKGDYLGVKDTSVVSIKGLSITNLHEFNLNSKGFFCLIGVTLSKINSVKLSRRGYYFDELIAGAEEYIYFSSLENYNPNSWKMFMNIGVAYKFNNKRIHASLESLFIDEIEFKTSLEEVVSKSFQFNVNLSYDLFNYKNSSFKTKTANNGLNFLSFNAFFVLKDIQNRFSYNVSFVRKLANKNIFFGAGFGTEINFNNEVELYRNKALYKINVFSEFLLLDNKKIGLVFNPGMYLKSEYQNPEFYLNSGINFHIKLKKSELIPFSLIRLNDRNILLGAEYRFVI